MLTIVIHPIAAISGGVRGAVTTVSVRGPAS